MNMDKPHEQDVLERTLAEVRRVRRYRARRKLAVFPLLLAAGVGGLVLSPNPAPTIAPPVPATVKVLPAVKSVDESLTVVEWRGGAPTLVEYSGEELGKLELSFSLEPVVAFPEEIW